MREFANAQRKRCFVEATIMIIMMTVTLFFDNYIAFKNRPFAYRVSRSTISLLTTRKKKKRSNFFIRDICLFFVVLKKRSTKNAQSFIPKKKKRKNIYIYVRIFSKQSVFFNCTVCLFRVWFFSLSLFFCINFIFHDRSTQTEVYRKAEVTK